MGTKLCRAAARISWELVSSLHTAPAARKCSLQSGPALPSNRFREFTPHPYSATFGHSGSRTRLESVAREKISSRAGGECHKIVKMILRKAEISSPVG